MLMNTISLRIYGGSQSVGLNPQPIVSAGTLPEGFRPSLPTIVNEQQSWMITHAQAYTAYALVLRDCRTADGQPGVMLMVLFLPPQQRLAGEKTPFSLLNSLHDFIAVNHMPDNRLPDAPVDSTPYQTLLQRYQLEERPTLLPIMTGVEPAAFCAEGLSQVEALMRYSRYILLSDVGRLEIGLHCPTTVQIPIKGKAQPKRDTYEQPQREQTNQEKPQTEPKQTKQVQPNSEKTQPEKQENVEPTIASATPQDSDLPETDNQKKNLKPWMKILGSVAILALFFYLFGLIHDSESEPIAATEPTKTVETPSVVTPAIQEEEFSNLKVIETRNGYTKYSDGTIMDDHHHLMWMTKDYMVIEGHALPNASWFKAMKWCEQMNEQRYAGYNDWRMPSVAELKTLCSDKAQRQFYKGFFEHANADYFWTNRSINNSVKSYVDLNDGAATSGDAEGKHNLRTGELFKFSVRLVRNTGKVTQEELKPEIKPGPQPNANDDRAEREKAAEKALQEAKKKADAVTAKAEILELVKKNASLLTIKKHPAFGQLTQAEAMDVEWYVDFDRLIEKKPYEIKKNKKHLKKQVYPNGINSWDDLSKGRISIRIIVNDFKAAEL